MRVREAGMASGKGISRPAFRSVAFLAVLLFSACGEAEGPAAAPVAATLEEVFVVESVMQLGEDPADSIADIGDFVELRNGGHVISDRFLPRVRSYDEEGRLEAAFGSLIDRIDAVGSHLVLTRARYNPDRPMPPREVLHTSLEVYDRHTGIKLYEDVQLPDESRVLGGGRFLYLLLNMHSPPWRIAKLRLLTED